MSLAMLLRPPPGDTGMNEWHFAHAQDHLDIIQKIQAATGIVLPTYIIDPMNESDFDGWARRHQALHDDMTRILGVEGTDLETVEWDNDEQRESWMWLNFGQHRDAHKRLGS